MSTISDLQSGVLAPRVHRVAGWRQFVLQNPAATISLLVLVAFVVLAVLGDQIAPYGPNEPTERYFGSPSWSSPFGTDHLGRDMLSRVIHGARVSLQVALLAVGMGTITGAAIGVATGFWGGVLDFVGQRFIDILMSLPGVLLALVIAASLGASLFNVSFAIGIAILPTSARVVRGATLSVRSRAFVEAARASGASDLRIIAWHIVPNVFAPLLVITTVQLGFAIIAEASLSYLGVGVPLGTPSWGSMLSGSALLYAQRAPWMGIAPGLALSLVVMATNLFGDALRDALDPRMRGSR